MRIIDLRKVSLPISRYADPRVDRLLMQAQ